MMFVRFRRGIRIAGASGLAAGLGAAVLVAGCGGGEDSTSASTTSQVKAQEQATTQSAPSQPSARRSERGGRSEARKRLPAPKDSGQSFAPKTHHDSGGGTKQFETKGGDNSIQESGSEASGSEFGQAAAVVHLYLDARAAGAWKDACGALSASVTESLTQLTSQGASDAARTPTCPQLLASLSVGLPRSALREAAKADVGAVRVEGDGGFVLFTGAEGTNYFIPIAKEGGTWKVAAIAASPVG
jgi:hypothetical protein